MPQAFQQPPQQLPSAMTQSPMPGSVTSVHNTNMLPPMQPAQQSGISQGSPGQGTAKV